MDTRSWEAAAQAIAVAHPDAAPPPGADESDATSAKSSVYLDPFQKLLCRGRRCCVNDAWPAGPNRRGRAMTVVAVQSDKPCDGDEQDDADTSEADTIDPHTCLDYWLVTDAGKGEKRPAKKWLDQECDADKWEYSVDVDLKTQTFTAAGHSLFSNTRTDNELVIGLDPLRVISEQEGSIALSHSSDERWNWDTFAGKLDLGIDYCPDKQPHDAGVEQDRDAPVLDTVAAILPRVTVPAAFADGGWRTARLGRCAATIDGAGDESGFAVFGGKGTATDASMRVVLSAARDLYVQIADDHLVASAKSWVKQDHLELWIAAQPPDCVDPTAPSPAVQWGIGIPDGRVYPAFGNPATAPVVEVHQVGGVVRLKITLGELLQEGGRITVAYSDSDDGVKQKRVIATSSLTYGRWWTLGQAREIRDDQATCVVQRGALEPRVKPFGREK